MDETWSGAWLLEAHTFWDLSHHNAVEGTMPGMLPSLPVRNTAFFFFGDRFDLTITSPVSPCGRRVLLRPWRSKEFGQKVELEEYMKYPFNQGWAPDPSCQSSGWLWPSLTKVFFWTTPQAKGGVLHRVETSTAATVPSYGSTAPLSPSFTDPLICPLFSLPTTECPPL